MIEDPLIQALEARYRKMQDEVEEDDRDDDFGPIPDPWVFVRENQKDEFSAEFSNVAGLRLHHLEYVNMPLLLVIHFELMSDAIRPWFQVRDLQVDRVVAIESDVV